MIFGPRRVGKTTLVKTYLKRNKIDCLSVTGDQARTLEVFSSRDERLMMDFIGGKGLLFIDEAQKIPDIGNNLKLLVDTHPELTVIATGSSSFQLAGQTGEPLTGRKHTLLLYPLAEIELAPLHSPFETKENYSKHLIYGMYPSILTSQSISAKERELTELVDSYLYRDILEFDRIKNPQQLRSLLQLLAFQIGSEVSLNELSLRLRIDVKTVGRYIDLLEQSFVLYRLSGFSRNLRKEITSKSKYYFYDLGVRNALINNFNPLNLRDDQGKLWENHMVVERLKSRTYRELSASDFFWRTWSQQEIDLVEQRAGRLYAYEFKWSDGKTPRLPSAFAEAYPGTPYTVVTPSNSHAFLTELLRVERQNDVRTHR